MTRFKDYSIVYFGNDWFAENRTSSHHVARCLAAQAPLLYIECPGIRAPKASVRDLRKVFRILKRLWARPKPIGERMWHLTLPQIPWRRFALLRKLNLWLGRFLVRRALSGLGVHQALSWFAVPHTAALAGKVGDRFIVYYCIDDYASFPDMNRAEIAALDEELTRKADQMFVSSSLLLERKRKLNPTVRYSPHGVDAALFAKASDPATELVEETAGLRHPVIGYFGTIGAWTDTALMAELARRRPEWTLLVIGHQAVDAGPLKECPNVVLAGPKPYATLPQWAKAFDVAIIPYLMTEQVKYSSPLKIREYLATGKPVVTVWTAEIAPFAGVARMASGPDEFLEQIELALRNDNAEEQRAARFQAVAEATWEARVREAVSVTEKRLQEKFPE